MTSLFPWVWYVGEWRLLSLFNAHLRAGHISKCNWGPGTAFTAYYTKHSAPPVIGRKILHVPVSSGQTLEEYLVFSHIPWWIDYVLMANKTKSSCFPSSRSVKFTLNLSSIFYSSCSGSRSTSKKDWRHFNERTVIGLCVFFLPCNSLKKCVRGCQSILCSSFACVALLFLSHSLHTLFKIPH